MKYQNLTKENFWNALFKEFPVAVKQFCDFIDNYKSENDWAELFNETPEQAGASDFEKSRRKLSPKYHDLPYAMQVGIYLQFAYSNNPNYQLRAFGGIQTQIWEDMKKLEEMECRRATKLYQNDGTIVMQGVVVERGKVDANGIVIDIDALVIDKQLPILVNFGTEPRDNIGTARLYKENGVIKADMSLNSDVLTGYPALAGTVKDEDLTKAKTTSYSLSSVGICLNKNADEGILPLHQQICSVRYEDGFKKRK